MLDKFISDYVSTCIHEGKSSPAAICMCIEDEIESLEEQIEKLKTRKRYLRMALFRLGGIEKKEQLPYVNLDLNFENLNEIHQNLCNDICDIVEQYYGYCKITPRSIMDRFPGSQHSLVYSLINWLIKHNFLKREESLIVKGDKFEQTL